jgi:hypothetical protein
MKDLFAYFKEREKRKMPIKNDKGDNFFGEIHMIFNDGKPVHTRDWQLKDDMAMVVESKKV